MSKYLLSKQQILSIYKMALSQTYEYDKYDTSCLIKDKLDENKVHKGIIPKNWEALDNLKDNLHNDKSLVKQINLVLKYQYPSGY